MKLFFSRALKAAYHILVGSVKSMSLAFLPISDFVLYCVDETFEKHHFLPNFDVILKI